MTQETTMTTDTLTVTEAPKPETALEAGALLDAKTICLVLNIGRFGNKRKASLAPVKVDDDKQVDADRKKLLKLTKQLIESPELVAISQFDSALTAKIRRLAFKSYLKGGVHRIPIVQVPEAEAILDAAIPERLLLVDRAVAVYQTRVDETLARLGDGLGNPLDYPSAERFRAKFYLEYSYLSFETPGRLKAVSAEIFKKEVDKQRVKLASVAGECQQAMRAGLLQLIDHLADRLSPSADGKKKRLHETTIGHLNDFLSTFELRNVTDDTDLGAIVEQARNVMKGLDKKVLKSDELIRQKVVAQLTTVKAALDPLVIDKPIREITFGDDDEG
jgi:hypothetical protein